MPPTIPQRGGPSGLKRPGLAGKTVFNAGAKRHRKIIKDCIRGITKPAIR
ncbi:71e4bd64-8800-4845-ab4c-23bdb683ea9a [Thermothielavioides terrestris]|nr:71e4bd64-8800-4845-ab4c-23bdb683ea9a [Thermothielavioides terrestris]